MRLAQPRSRRAKYGADDDSLLEETVGRGDIAIQEMNQVLSEEFNLPVIDLSLWEFSA